jgi:hypothetical protein
MGFLIKHKADGSLAGPAAAAERHRKTAGLLGVCVLAAHLATGCASQPPASDASRRPMRLITDFQTLETPEVVAVLVKSDRPLTYTATRQEDPRGVLFQFPETGLEGLDATYFPPPNPVIRAIRTAEAAAGQETRVFMELSQETSYEVLTDTEGLRILFRKAPAAPSFAGMPALSGAAAPPPPRPPSATSKRDPGPSQTAATAPPPATPFLRDVRTEVRADAVLIRVTADGALKNPTVFTLDHPARIVFDFMGLRSPFKGEQRIPVRSEWISQVRHLGYPDKVRLVADTAAPHLKSYSLEPTAEGFLITVGDHKR